MVCADPNGRKGVFRPIRRARIPCTLGLWKSRPESGNGSPSRLFDGFEQAGDLFVELSAFLSQLFHFLDGVDHRRMVLAAETAANLGQRRVRERFTEIHRDLARHGD